MPLPWLGTRQGGRALSALQRPMRAKPPRWATGSSSSRQLVHIEVDPCVRLSSRPARQRWSTVPTATTASILGRTFAFLFAPAKPLLWVRAESRRVAGDFLKPERGLEPLTSCLQGGRSTRTGFGALEPFSCPDAGLRRFAREDKRGHMRSKSVAVCCKVAAKNRAGAGTRTPDIFITSEVLYQLSYAGP